VCVWVCVGVCVFLVGEGRTESHWLKERFVSLKRMEKLYGKPI